MAAAKTPSIKEQLAAAAAEARPAGPSGGQNYALVGLMGKLLQENGVLDFDEEIRKSLRTRVGASAMISTLKDILNVEDLRELDREVGARDDD